MNLATIIKQKFMTLNQLEDDLIDADLLDFDTKRQIEDQRQGLKELQHELKSLLDVKYPKNNIETSFDMFEQYDFEIRIKKKTKL
jgi:hypothetical protein